MGEGVEGEGGRKAGVRIVMCSNESVCQSYQIQSKSAILDIVHILII